jgi:hypothetical protein
MRTWEDTFEGLCKWWRRFLGYDRPGFVYGCNIVEPSLLLNASVSVSITLS